MRISCDFARPSLLTALVAVLVSLTGSPSAADRLQPGASVWLHAHNCYPEKGQWGDRIQRALAVRTSDIAIEQDVAWFVDPSTGRGRIVVSHDAKPDGTEPTLEAHFFDRVRPIVEAALRDNRKDTWPVMVLHLDFKTNEPAHHQAVWDLLGKYESWLTTAERVADEQRVTPFTPGPILVLTEAGPNQVDTFYTRVPVGGRLRLFGTIPPATLPAATTAEERAAAASSATPDVLIPTGATNYRRWTNFAWAVVELGGQNKAGAVDQRRRPAAARDRDAGPRDGLVGAVLHAQRPFGRREQGLDGELQLRLDRRGPRAHGRSARCGSRVHRQRPVRGARRRAVPGAPGPQSVAHRSVTCNVLPCYGATCETCDVLRAACTCQVRVPSGTYQVHAALHVGRGAWHVRTLHRSTVGLSTCSTCRASFHADEFT